MSEKTYSITLEGLTEDDVKQVIHALHDRASECSKNDTAWWESSVRFRDKGEEEQADRRFDISEKWERRTGRMYDIASNLQNQLGEQEET